MEADDGVLVIKRIHTTYKLNDVPDELREKAERVLGFHAEKCPVARSIGGSIDITTSLEYV